MLNLGYTPTMDARLRAGWLILVLLIAASIPACAQYSAEDFNGFLKEFTSSASFQYSRIHFPLESEVVLLDSKEEEKSFPFTKEMWPLLDEDCLKVERVFLDEEGAYYVSHYVLNESDRKEFEAGYEESDLDLRVVFVRMDGKWFVVDCYNSWYSYDLPAEEIDEAIRQVKEENLIFIQTNP